MHSLLRPLALLLLLLLPLCHLVRAARADGPNGITVQLEGNGPVIKTNFPDPCLAKDTASETWYAFSTQSDNVNIQMASSTDCSNWTLHAGYDALPTLGSWAQLPPHAGAWAPDVNQRPDGSWIMYYAALHRHKNPRRHCIGAAISNTIEGPYDPLNTTLVCDLERGGNIDPNLFRDPQTNAVYLLYKTDGNTIGHGGACGNTKTPLAPTPLYMQQLDPTDLLTPIGAPIFLFSNGAQDGPNVERPLMVHLGGTYFLLYNSHCFQSPRYRVDYVSCVGASSVTGCDWATLKYGQARTRAALLQTGNRLIAPGSVDSDGQRMIFHADLNRTWFDQKPPPPPGSPAAQDKGPPRVRRDRAMFAADLDVDPVGGTLSVRGFY